jgi:hypothetical protein
MHLPRALHFAVSFSKAKNGSAPRFSSESEVVVKLASYKKNYALDEFLMTKQTNQISITRDVQAAWKWK